MSTSDSYLEYHPNTKPKNYKTTVITVSVVIGLVVILIIALYFGGVILNNKDVETTVLKSKEGVFKADQVTLSNREPEYYYTDGEYEIRGHKSHNNIDDTSTTTSNIITQASDSTFKLVDREKVLLETFKSNIKTVFLRDDLTALQNNSFWISETSKGIYPTEDSTYVGYVINKVMK
jgi:hypothetical protein